MLNTVKNKAFFVVLVGVISLIGTVCFATLNWSYLSDCSLGFEKTKIGILQRDGLTCYGSTMVYDNDYAGITLYLKTLDDDGDWVTVTAWEDIDTQVAVVDVDYAVGSGTYRIETTHKAFLPDDLDTPVEMHYMESEEITIP